MNLCIEPTKTQSDLRWCRACKELHPPQCFKPNHKHKFSCIAHLKEKQRQYTFGTHEKRAFSCLRFRAKQDKAVFRQQRMIMSKEQITAILSGDQMANYSLYSLIPKNPNKNLSADNALVVTMHQRRYIISRWKAMHDVDEYKSDIDFIIRDQAQVACPVQ